MKRKLKKRYLRKFMNERNEFFELFSEKGISSKGWKYSLENIGACYRLRKASHEGGIKHIKVY